MVDQPGGERDRILRWVFRRVFGRRPRGDELQDYAHAIVERDRLGLDNALPIFEQLRRARGKVAPLPIDPAAWRSPVTINSANFADLPESAPDRSRQDGEVGSAQASAEVAGKNDLSKNEKSFPVPASSPESPPAGTARLSAPKRAEAIVREQLANGPVPGDLVKAVAAEAKVSERFLIAAAERLGVRSQRGQWWLPG